MGTLAWHSMPLLILLTSLVTGIVIFIAGEQRVMLRTVMNLAGALAKLVLVGIMLIAVAAGHEFEFRVPLMPGLDLLLRVDALTMLFTTLSAILWLLTTIYAIGYLEGTENRARFFGFFSLCVAATMGVAGAGNLFTFFIFYELLTLATWPLVVHRGTPEAFAAGRSYLRYTLFGSAVFLVGLVWLNGLAGSQDFVAGGYLAHLAADHRPALIGIGLLLLVGMGVKASLVPLHPWLPRAMVAPAPVSALLHAVAVVKAGAFGIVRVYYDIYGIDLAGSLHLTTVLAVAAAFTILYGSIRALAQTAIKQRLAFSTVSQVSYILLGVALASPMAAIGGLVHLVHQGVMKITLFFCAGNWGETLGVHQIRELDGTGKRLPWTGISFTIGALGMMGLPPVAGFVTKWHLGAGAVQANQYWVIGVLVASTVLNAMYFLPMIYRIWFRPPPETWPEESVPADHQTRLALLVPTVLVAAMAVSIGVLASHPASPLSWVQLIISEYY